jgi:hypothetical protein
MFLYLLQSGLVVPKIFYRVSVHARDYDFFLPSVYSTFSTFVQRHTPKALLEFLNPSDLTTLHSLDDSRV